MIVKHALSQAISLSYKAASRKLNIFDILSPENIMALKWVPSYVIISEPHKFLDTV